MWVVAGQIPRVYMYSTEHSLALTEFPGMCRDDYRTHILGVHANIVTVPVPRVYFHMAYPYPGYFATSIQTVQKFLVWVVLSYGTRKYRSSGSGYTRQNTLGMGLYVSDRNTTLHRFCFKVLLIILPTGKAPLFVPRYNGSISALETTNLQDVEHGSAVAEQEDLLSGVAEALQKHLCDTHHRRAIQKRQERSVATTTKKNKTRREASKTIDTALCMDATLTLSLREQKMWMAALPNTSSCTWKKMPTLV